LRLVLTQKFVKQTVKLVTTTHRINYFISHKTLSIEQSFCPKSPPLLYYQ